MPNDKTAIAIMLSLTFTVFGLYLVRYMARHDYATAGYTYYVILKNLEDLKKENAQLKEAILAAEALQTIARKAEGMGFVPAPLVFLGQ